MPAPISYGFGNAVDDYFDAYYAELDGAGNADAARKSLNAFKLETYKRMEPYFAARAQFDSDASQVRGLNVELNALQAQHKQLDDNSQAAGTPLANGAYWSLAENFRTFKSLVGNTGYDIIALPRMMLVLLLSIFMGVLGSLIYITKDFYQDPDRRGFWSIIFRVGLGAGVAFALFFFAAAGMLAMGAGQERRRAIRHEPLSHRVPGHHRRLSLRPRNAMDARDGRERVQGEGRRPTRPLGRGPRGRPEGGRLEQRGAGLVRRRCALQMPMRGWR